MGSKSNYLENAVQNHILGGTVYTRPTTVWFGLWDSSDGSLGEDSNGDTSGEIVGANYSRVGVTNNTTLWGTDTSDSTRKNAVEITFPTASGPWGSTSVDQMAILDDSVGGEILYFANLGTAKVITSGDSVRYNIGDITIVEN